MKQYTSTELRELYRQFFESKGHTWIPSASLVPENDPTVLFTTAGMHPLVPYLLSEPHPAGKRLASAQKCIRTGDIDEVGDPIHHTFFEMLGNWSLGDYFKKEAIEWSFEFLTSEKWLNIPIHMLAVSVFAGDDDAPLDQEAYDLWLGLGISEKRIAKLPKKNNWWGPAGQTGPCGPDTEMFYWTGGGEVPAEFDPENDLWVEIWNDVFMQYNKTADGTFEPLKQKNVDTGFGLVRVLAVLNVLDDNYKTDLFWPVIQSIETVLQQKYEDWTKEFRIVADHAVASVFAIADGVSPSNKGAGYVVRRLIRRAIVKAQQLQNAENILETIAQPIFDIYLDAYPDLLKQKSFILAELSKEEAKFRKTLQDGLKQFQRQVRGGFGGYAFGVSATNEPLKLNGEQIFDLYQTYGFPKELSLEVAHEKNVEIIDLAGFEKASKKHQELSQSSSAGVFKGGLADHSEITTKYHTATHLLQAALRQILGAHVSQKGSNITAERLRFDFSHAEKMTEEQIKQVEDLVNEKIQADLPVSFAEMTVDDAKKAGALGVFDDRYASKVKMYSVGDPSTDSGQVFSKEICGGPHVEHTGVIGHFKITKEEAVSSGIRRIKAVVT